MVAFHHARDILGAVKDSTAVTMHERESKKHRALRMQVLKMAFNHDDALFVLNMVFKYLGF